ncbi:histidine kinase [Virgisporangium aliadipatigenens]|uniref:histidine kinase n=1 Tax=Virgisporangium aliadipatigenens TaxID=741659 RepID=A0A8J3YQG4_9ACTN|nr:ATP-binding protein [Virgisporangium aliadipatigenens]GIJ49561.1 histidine kinase [Virgisporangium aliadipatigenens]
MKDWTLSRRVSALFAGVSTVLVLIALVTAGAVAVYRAGGEQVMDNLTPARVNSERLYQGLLRQQTSARTFLLTAREDDLATYRDAVTAESGLITETLRLLRDEPQLRDDLEAIRDALATYRREITEPLIAAARADGPSAALATPTDRSRTVYRAASDRITLLGEHLVERRDEVRADVNSSGRLLLALLLFAAAVIAVAGFMLVTILRRLITLPVSALASEVRLVADGDYERRLSAKGAPELVELATDVDRMRRQIADDLAVVRNARETIEEANAQLRAQTEELTRSNRDLEQFAYVASHDLQEPLRKVASFCQLLQRRYAGQLDERADQYIHFAVDGAQRMQRLINDLLAFSRIGRITNEFTEIDLKKLASEAAASLDSVRTAQAAEITWDDDLPVVRGEEPLLQALVTNLFSNALKFHKPDLPAKVHLSARRVDDEWELSCRDNGIGIPPEYADKVFVIFQRLHPKDSYPGTGIGLAIVKKIIEYHGGRTWVDADYREGADIRLTFPAT